MTINLKQTKNKQKITIIKQIKKDNYRPKKKHIRKQKQNVKTNIKLLL